LQRALSVTDGRTIVGTVMLREAGWVAIAPDGTTVGKFATQAEAVRALPARKAVRP
jgi:hypothetical protein